MTNLKKLLVAIPLFAHATLFAGEKSESLEKIINDDLTPGFACSFGTFKVKVKSHSTEGDLAELQGSGLLINSGWLHHDVGANPAITYRFPKGVDLPEGMVLSAFCNGLGDHEAANITYYVAQNKPVKK